MNDNNWKKLSKYLAKCNEKQVILSFDEIEDLIHAKLPEEASRAEWWWNSNSSKRAKCWLSENYKTKNVKNTIHKKQITFVRTVNTRSTDHRHNIFLRAIDFITDENNSTRKKAAVIVAAIISIVSLVFTIVAAVYTVKSYYRDQREKVKNEKFQEYYEFGERYLREQNYSEAAKYFEMALDTYDDLNIPYDRDSVKAFVSLADIFDKMWLYNSALDQYIKAISVMDNLNLEKEDYFDLNIQMAYVYLQLTEFEKAEECFDKSKKMFDEDEIAAFEQVISDIYFINDPKEDVHDPKTKSDLFMEKLVSVDADRFSKYLKLVYLSASIDMFEGNYEAAVSRYEQLLVFWDNLYECKIRDDRLVSAVLYDSISICYIHLGNMETAKEYNQSAIDIFDKEYGKCNIDTGISYCNFGMTCLDMNEYETAYDYLKLSELIIREKIGENNELMAGIYNDMGLYFAAINDDEQAEDYYSKCIQIFDDLKIHNIDLVRTYLNYANSLIDLNKLSEANEMADKAYYLALILVDHHNREYQLCVELRNYLRSITPK